MRVHRTGGYLADGLHYREAEGDVGYQSAVHDVQMDVV